MFLLFAVLMYRKCAKVTSVHLLLKWLQTIENEGVTGYNEVTKKLQEVIV